jgi:NADH-quinone oxidoreductase subunit E
MSMLTAEEKHEIDEEVTHYPQKDAVSIDALKIVQRHRGWVSDEGITDIAAYLELSPDELDSVATFYNLIYRQPVGRHVILLCNSVSCWIMGYQRLYNALRERLGIDMGATTPDNRFTLLPMVCLGTCDHAPALMIDDQLFRDLEPGKLDAILDQYE